MGQLVGRIGFNKDTTRLETGNYPFVQRCANGGRQMANRNDAVPASFAHGILSQISDDCLY